MDAGDTSIAALTLVGIRDLSVRTSYTVSNKSSHFGTTRRAWRTNAPRLLRVSVYASAYQTEHWSPNAEVLTYLRNSYNATIAHQVLALWQQNDNISKHTTQNNTTPTSGNYWRKEINEYDYVNHRQYQRLPARKKVWATLAHRALLLRVRARPHVPLVLGTSVWLRSRRSRSRKNSHKKISRSDDALRPETLLRCLNTSFKSSAECWKIFVFRSSRRLCPVGSVLYSG